MSTSEELGELVAAMLTDAVIRYQPFGATVIEDAVIPDPGVAVTAERSKLQLRLVERH
jgi:hypothetical protein